MRKAAPTPNALRSVLLATLAPFALVTVALAGCPSSTPPPTDGGTQIPNICNSQSDAQSQAQCQLVLAGPPVCYYMDHVGKTLFLAAPMPAVVTAQSLLTIEAGYDPKGGSPVELSLNVVTAAQAGIATGQNIHDPGAPGPINITTTPPTSVAGQQIFLIFTDASGTHDDTVNQFCVTANVVTDPDKNQAGVPTQITLGAGASGIETNSPPATGDLSTPGRVDEYYFTVDSSITRPILYFSITVPPNPDGGVLTPPIAYLMGYNLYDCGPASTASPGACAGNPPTTAPGGSVAGTAHMPNVFIPVDLATALLVKPGEMYVLEVLGFNSNNNDTNTVPGDIRVNYDLTVEEMPDLDSYDGTTPTAVTPSLGGAAVTLSSGRLSYVSQVDSFAINVAGQSNNTRIHYLFTPGTTGSGRFPELPAGLTAPRIATVAIPVSASLGADAGFDCFYDYDTCPTDVINLNAGGPAGGIVEQYCFMDGGAECLYSYRQEDPSFPNLGNFEGIIPVKAGSSVVNLDYEWQSGLGADDVPYTLAVTWLPEGPENQQPPYHWSPATAIQATFPATLNGELTLGDTLTSDNQTVRGLNDYDAIPSTLDVYQFTFPSVGSAAEYGATWGFSYTIQNSGNNGGPPLTFEFAPSFCTTNQGATTCTEQQNADPFYNLQALYYNTSGGVWYPTTAAQDAWGQTMSGGDTVDTVLPAACYCFQPQYLAAGSFYLYVFGTNRTSYADATYSITTSLSDYPQSFGDGGCPFTAPNADAGIVAVGCGMGPPSCGGSGNQCTSDGDCCSKMCNTSNPCSPGMSSGSMMGSSGGSCSQPGFGFCD
jgi:hypothetical protein